MSLAEGLSPSSAPRPAFDAVPWRLWDILIGLAPFIAVGAGFRFVDATVLHAMPRWMLPVLVLAPQAWMLAFTLWMARRRAGRLPGLPTPRRFLIEGAIAVPLVLGTWIVIVVLLFAQELVMGAPQAANDPVAEIVNKAGPDLLPSLLVIGVGFVPIAEELLFRGLIFNALRRRMSLVLAALIQGAGFGLAHTLAGSHSFSAAVPVAVFGVVAALVYRWRKSLVTPIMMHAVHNACLFAVVLATAEPPPNPTILGVHCEDLERGCRITSIVPDSPASAAGLEPDDVITSVDGKNIGSPQELTNVIRRHQPGDEVVIHIVRDAGREEVAAVLASRD